MNKKHVHYLIGTETLTYPTSVVATSNGLNPFKKKLLIETTVGQSNRFLLLGLIVKLNFINQLHDFSQLIKGLNEGEGRAYLHTDGRKYHFEEKLYTTDGLIASREMQSNEILKIKDVLKPYFELIKKSDTNNFIKTSEFLLLRNYDEELAAILGTINELVLEGESALEDAHLKRIYTAINSVFLMGYPPKIMIA